jgi:hypothetical protein
VFALIAAYILTIYFLQQYDWLISAFFFGMSGLLLVFNIIFTYFKIRTIELPASYFRIFLLSSAIQLVGIVFLFAPSLSKYLF